MTEGASSWGHFTLLERIGAGATGEVWRAWDSLLHRDVAVKFLQEDSPSAGARPGGQVAGTPLLEEARALARVQHPNVVSIYGIAELDGRPGLWMELLRGPTLAAEIQRRGALPCEEVARIGAQIAAALEVLAHAGLVHRDIKPANVILESDGRAVLADFGLGWRSKAAPDAPAPGSGTPVFMAPGLFEGEDPSPRTDLYALGVTLRWALTGRAPFRARTLDDLREQASRGPVRALTEERPDAPGALVESIERAMSAGVDAPPFRAGEMRTRLLALLEPSRPGPPSPRPRGPSVAVLPFLNLGTDPSDEYFSEGLADEMITVLSKLRGLHVAARTSSFQFKGRTEDLARIGEKLHVSTILEGSVRKLGDRVRISVGLVNVPQGDHVWSETYDRALDDIFAVQDDIAQAVVRKLRETLLSDPGWEAGVAAAARGRGRSPEAHRLYLEARYLAGFGTPDAAARGIARMLEALRIEPGHALAWAWLCRAYGHQVGMGRIPQAEGIEKARAAARRALELEPDLAEAHAAVGQHWMRHGWDWASAEASLHRALALSPGSADVLRSAGTLARNLGHVDVAIDLHRRSTELDPLGATGYISLGSSYRAAARFEEAVAAYRKALELAPQRTHAHAQLALVLVEQGRSEEALAEARLEPMKEIRLLALAVIHFVAGRLEESDPPLRELVEKHAASAAYQIAEVYAARGETDEAFEWLERAYAQGDPGLADVGADRLFRPLHGDERWGEFLGKMGLAGSASRRQPMGAT